MKNTLLEEVQRITDYLKVRCYRLSLTAHIFFTYLSSYDTQFARIQAASESWAFCTGVVANVLPTRLRS